MQENFVIVGSIETLVVVRPGRDANDSLFVDIETLVCGLWNRERSSIGSIVQI
jgi:hypothetical protein